MGRAYGSTTPIYALKPVTADQERHEKRWTGLAGVVNYEPPSFGHHTGHGGTLSFETQYSVYKNAALLNEWRRPGSSSACCAVRSSRPGNSLWSHRHINAMHLRTRNVYMLNDFLLTDLVS